MLFGSIPWKEKWKYYSFYFYISIVLCHFRKFWAPYSLTNLSPSDYSYEWETPITDLELLSDQNSSWTTVWQLLTKHTLTEKIILKTVFSKE